MPKWEPELRFQVAVGIEHEYMQQKTRRMRRWHCKDCDWTGESESVGIVHENREGHTIEDWWTPRA